MSIALNAKQLHFLLGPVYQLRLCLIVKRKLMVSYTKYLHSLFMYETSSESGKQKKHFLFVCNTTSETGLKTLAREVGNDICCK